MKIKFSGYFDTEEMLFVFEKFKAAEKRGRKKDKPSRLAALVMADAWGESNFTGKRLNKETRVGQALPKGYSDGGSQRRAISKAKKQESDLFQPPHNPGLLVYGKVGAVWFSDRATSYPDLIVGYAWVWRPGLNDAIFTIAEATKGEN